MTSHPTNSLRVSVQLNDRYMHEIAYGNVFSGEGAILAATVPIINEALATHVVVDATVQANVAWVMRTEELVGKLMGETKYSRADFHAVFDLALAALKEHGAAWVPAIDSLAEAIAVKAIAEHHRNGGRYGDISDIDKLVADFMAGHSQIIDDDTIDPSLRYCACPYIGDAQTEVIAKACAHVDEMLHKPRTLP
jgi:hypothetical protein